MLTIISQKLLASDFIKFALTLDKTPRNIARSLIHNHYAVLPRQEDQEAI